MSRIIRVRYENGVLKPLEPVEFREGQELVIEVKDPEEVERRKRILEKFKGILGPVDPKLLEEALEEAESL